MRFKKSTENSSDQIRGIASMVLTFGIGIAILLVIMGVGILKNDYYSSDGIFSSIGMMFIVAAIIALFWHYITYVLISSYATFLENSDRTDVIDALYDINDTLRDMGNLSDKVQKTRYQKAMEERAEREKDIE